MNFSYHNMPCYSDESLGKEFDGLTAEVQRKYAEAFDAWLGRQVTEFCPEAAESVKRGDVLAATRILNEGDYMYRALPGGLTEFCQGDVVLARVKFEINFGLRHSTAELPEKGVP